MKKIIPILLALVLTMGLIPGASADKVKYSAVQLDLFDTVTSVIGYADSKAEFDAAAERFHSEMLVWNDLFDIYNDYEGVVNLKTVNDAAGETVAVPAELMEFLLYARDVAEMTDGRVDITLGPVLLLWHEAREYGIAHPAEAYLPDEEALKEAMTHTGFDKVELDAENNTVRLTDPLARLDVGALAKGYAAQKVCEGFETGYLISVGGNVLCTGPKPVSPGTWSVGVQNPFEPNGYNYPTVMRISGGSVVTSGDYQRYYTVDDVNYHHIIDPDTLYPSLYHKSVTIICEDSGIGDALSTALFLMSVEDGTALLEKFGAEALWIEADGSIYYTEGFGYEPYT